MLDQAQLAQLEPAEWLGDLHPLVEQLGSSEGLATLSAVSASLQIRPVENLSTLRRFLKSYQSQILLPIELPAIHHAFTHAIRNELRELIVLDKRLAGEPMLQDFSGASRRVGQSQLKRLAPLRDHRLVQRYLAAVEQGEAHGWHTLVYGLTLAIYSLPLRQGLHGYAQGTLRGFIHAAGRPLRLSEKKSQKLLEELCAELPAPVDALLAQSVIA